MTDDFPLLPPQPAVEAEREAEKKKLYRECFAIGCSSRASVNHPFCMKHWNQIPPDMQARESEMMQSAITLDQRAAIAHLDFVSEIAVWLYYSQLQIPMEFAKTESRVRYNRIKFNGHRFTKYEKENGGCLTPHPACHALWYYYLLARKNFEEIERDPVVYEGEEDPRADYRQLLTTVAMIYGVKPEQMVPFWPVVDQQCGELELPLLPDVDRMRWNAVPEIGETQ